MTIQRGEVLRVIESADHPLGVREILKQGGFHPGQQTDLKRVLRDLVRSGALIKIGKRFEPPGGVRAPEAAPHARPGAGAAKGPRAGRGEGRGGERTERGRAQGRPTQRGGSAQRPWQARGRGGPGTGEFVEGILHVHRDGFGFVHPLVAAEENIYLPFEEASRALDGDKVRVELAEGRGGRTMGRLVEVLDRVRSRAVGVYRQEGRRAWVVPNDKSLPGDIRVPPTQLARSGDLVKVVLGVGAAVLEPGTDLFGEVVGSIGQPGEPSGEVLSVAYSQGFNDEFPAQVMAEADRFALQVSDAEAAEPGRRDLRTLPLLTIDGEDARDFDDAVYCEPVSGGWRLVVAIADVSNYVREGNPLDTEALHRGTSVYLPDRVLPMLPERLSNGICSLRPEEDRLCMVADMTLADDATLRSYELYPAVMRSVARCTYNEVQDVLDGKDVPHRNVFRPHFENLMTLARALHAMRVRRGAIDFDLPEYKVILDEEGNPERLDKRERKDSHRLIEECMLAANEAVAKFFQDRELPSVYRFHGEPDEEKLEAFVQLAQAYGFDIGSKRGISSRDLNLFLEELSGHPERRALNHLLLRSMMQAVYSAENVGHYGLGAEHYLHFTSPIRRYPDLLVHRLLKEHWARGGKAPSQGERDQKEAHLEALAMQSSERERAAVAVEREVVAYYQTLLMKDRIGEEFAATVSSVTDFGFFVEVDEVHVEGLVKLESLGPGGELDTALHALVWPNGRRVKVGEAVQVRLISANLERRQLEFDAVGFGDEAPLEARRGSKPAAREEREADESSDEVPRPSGSPHPGFDRLRALAAHKGGGGGRTPRGGGAKAGKGKPGGDKRRTRGGSQGAPAERVVERDKFGNPKRPSGGRSKPKGRKR